MKFSVHISLLPIIIALLGACASPHKKNGYRDISSLEQAIETTNRIFSKKKYKVKPISFLKKLKSPKEFEKLTGIKIKRLSKSITSMSSDTNKDGKADLISKFKNGKLVSVKTDRNYDGKFDRFETLGHQIQKIKYDNDYNGKIDKILTRKPIASNRILETIYYPKTKKKHSYKQLTSHADSHNSEGKFCGDCEGQFRKAVKDMRSPEAKERREAKWEEMDFADIDFFVNEPGYERSYLKMEPSIWLSDTCASEYDELVPVISDAINEYFSCMQNWKKIKTENPKNDNIKRKNASKLMQGFVEQLSSPTNPFKINCDRSPVNSFAWAIPDKSAPNPSDIPENDRVKSIVLNLRKTSKLDTNSKKMKSLIMHEITHLHTGPHGVGADNSSTCSVLCLGKESLYREKELSDDEWNQLRPKLENICLAGRDIDHFGKNNLGTKPYTYLNDIFSIFSAEGGSPYGEVELGNQIIKEVANSTKKSPILFKTISSNERMKLAYNYLMASGNWKEEKIKQILKNNSDTNWEDISHPSLILSSIILNEKPLTQKKITQMIDASEEIESSNYLVDTLKIIQKELSTK